MSTVRDAYVQKTGPFLYTWMKKDVFPFSVFFQAVCQALTTAHVTVGGIIQQVALQFHLGHFQASQDIPADPIGICIRLHFGCYIFRNTGKPRQDFNCQLNTQGVFQETLCIHFRCSSEGGRLEKNSQVNISTSRTENRNDVLCQNVYLKNMNAIQKP